MIGAIIDDFEEFSFNDCVGFDIIIKTLKKI